MCTMISCKWPCWLAPLFLLLIDDVFTAEDYNILNRDGSFEFGYDTPDSFHKAQGNRNNVVRGQFGGRNPGTGAIDTTDYTAGPRGFRPRGKNVVRKYDLSQVGARPVGSKDDPYFDPNEDPSYNFAFRTRTYNRDESANRVGDVNGRYSYIDDVGETHNVEFVAGKNTGFHVKTPFPDSNPRSYGPLFFNGRGKPLPRGRTAIQRGLDGSYRFISAGPDQRRTETSDAAGNVRGSYTYLDPKGVQHSVHYIAGPEIGYRVLKNVRGPHLPTVYPFNRPEIVPPGFYEDGGDKTTGDVFHTAASGHVKPTPPSNSIASSARPSKDEDIPGFDGEVDKNWDKYNDNLGKPSSDVEDKRPGGPYGGASRPEYGTGGSTTGGSSTTPRPTFGPSGGGRPNRPSFGAVDGSNRPSYGNGQGGGVGGRPPFGTGIGKPSYDEDGGDDIGDLFGPSSTFRPIGGGFGGSSSGSTSGGGSSAGDETSGGSGESAGFDDGSYKPSGEDGSYAPGAPSSTPRPSSPPSGFGSSDENEGGNISDIDSDEMFGTSGTSSRPPPSSSSRPVGFKPRPGYRPGGGARPAIGGGVTRPIGGSRPRPGRPNYDEDGTFGSNDLNDDFGLFEGSPSTRPPTSSRPGGLHIGILPAEDEFGRPIGPNGKPIGRPGVKPAGRPGGRPSGRPETAGRPGSGPSSKPVGPPGGRPSPGDGYDRPVTPGSGTTAGEQEAGPTKPGGRPTGGPSDQPYDQGDRDFLVPPGVSVRAHVQAIDLLPIDFKVPSPSDQYIADTILAAKKDITGESSKLTLTTTPSSKTTNPSNA